MISINPLKAHTQTKAITDKVKKGIVGHPSNSAELLFASPKEEHGDKFVSVYQSLVEYLKESGLEGLMRSWPRNEGRSSIKLAGSLTVLPKPVNDPFYSVSSHIAPGQAERRGNPMGISWAVPALVCNEGCRNSLRGFAVRCWLRAAGYGLQVAGC